MASDHSPRIRRPANQALTPVPQGDRVFHFHEHAALWFSLGTGLLVMQIGAYLVPAVGTQDAVIAIVLGSLIGAGLLAWTARLGCQTGLASAGLMHATYGSAFARLPVLLNIAQLVGWTTFELVIMQEGTVAILKQALGSEPGGLLDGTGGKLLATLLWGGVLIALMAGSMLKLVRKFVSRFGLPLVIASLAWLTWQFGTRLQAQGFEAFWNRPGAGGMGLFSAMDLVIAMPVSWLPLVADYARHGKRAATTLGGTWLGYALANIWCYALGVLVVSTVEPGTNLVGALLLAQGGLIALGLILLDEMDNAYGDAHSGAVSVHSLQPRWSIQARRPGVCRRVHGARAVPADPRDRAVPADAELGVRAAVRRDPGPPGQRCGGARRDRSARWTGARRRCGWPGIACYHLLKQYAPDLGSALPTLALTFTLAALSRPRNAGGLTPARA